MNRVILFGALPEEASLVKKILTEGNFKLLFAKGIAETKAMISDILPEVLIIRLAKGFSNEVWNLVAEFQSINPLGPVILIVDQTDKEILNKSLYYGVRDCLEKDTLSTSLLFSISFAIDRTLDLQYRVLKNENQKYDNQIERLQEALSQELDKIFRLQDELSNTGHQMLSVLINALEIADPYVRGHSQRVANLAKKIAGRMNQAYLMSHGVFSLNDLETAGLLHDVGKLGIPDTILNKKQKLTQEEWDIIKRHPTMGAEIVINVGHLSTIAQDIKYHHERWDGFGYPEGLKGEKIPIKARILSLADAFDAMVSPRVYRKARGLPEAVDEVKKNAGTHFDPQVVEGLLWAAGDN